MLSVDAQVKSRLTLAGIKDSRETLIFSIFHLGDHVLYWSFDTLNNLTTMERS